MLSSLLLSLTIHLARLGSQLTLPSPLPLPSALCGCWLLAPQGCVYLKYATMEAAAAAQLAMHGRWFAGRQLAVDFCFAHSYAQYFGV